MFFSPQTFNYSCPTSENRRKLKIQKLKRSTGTVACRKIKGISCSPSAGNTDTGTLSNRKGTWAKENRDLDWSGPEWHCHKWKRAKEEAEEQNGFTTVHWDSHEETPGARQFCVPTLKYGNTGTYLEIGTHERFMVQEVLTPSVQWAQPEESKLGTSSTVALGVAALPELTQIK